MNNKLEDPSKFATGDTKYGEIMSKINQASFRGMLKVNLICSPTCCGCWRNLTHLHGPRTHLTISRRFILKDGAHADQKHMRPIVDNEIKVVAEDNAKSKRNIFSDYKLIPENVNVC